MPLKNKPKYPCGTCSKSAQTNALLCNFCDMWDHATIECIPWHSKETINTLMEICKEQSCWTCQKCTGIMKKLNGRMVKLEKDVKEVQDNVEGIRTKLDTTDGVVAELQTELAEVRKSAAEESNTVQCEVLSEIKDREERKHNVIVNGLQESTATEKAALQVEENEHLDKLFTDMQLNPDTTSQRIKFKTRLGAKQPGKPRPLLVKFHDVHTRDSVLQNGRKVLTSKIRIKPDLTKAERAEDEKFKKKVDEENKSKPTDDSGDYRWKVAGPPGNLRKVKVRNIAEWEQGQQRREAAQAAH